MENSTQQNANIFKKVFGIFMIVINLFLYICLGVYYVFYYIVIIPKDYIVNLFYEIFTPKGVKKQKEIIAVDILENKNNGDVSNDARSIDNQMANNKMKIKKQPKISKKTKEKIDKEKELLIKSINESAEKRLEKPEIFRYKALSPEGKLVNDIFFGVSKIDIYTFLTNEGYVVYSIQLSKLDNLLQQYKLSGFTKLSNKSLMFFLTQLATYIKSGITLTESMKILAKQMAKNKNESRIMQAIVYYLVMGESFSNALQKLPGVFPNMVINMIKAAEATGDLAAALDDLNNYYTEVNKTRKEMISAMTYPSIVLLFAIVVVAFILIKIVPQFQGIYSSAGAKMNPLTVFVIKASAFLQANILTILLILVLIVFLFFMAYKNVFVFRKTVQTLLMRAPVFGSIIISNEMAIFTKTFASLLKNDVYITDTIDILSKLTENEIYKEIMINTISNIAKGEKISASFKDHWAIPDIAYFMIVTGENTGELASMMMKVSEYYQDQHRAMIATLKSLIEPFMIIFLAITVGGIMVAVLMPMFGLYGSIG